MISSSFIFIVNLKIIYYQPLYVLWNKLWLLPAFSNYRRYMDLAGEGSNGFGSLGLLEVYWVCIAWDISFWLAFSGSWKFLNENWWMRWLFQSFKMYQILDRKFISLNIW